MPSFQDSALIFFIALLLFGPKKLPELAKQLGKLMGEFRRASNEFRMQMEDELRVAEQSEQQKKIAAMQAAAPVAPAITETPPVAESGTPSDPSDPKAVLDSEAPPPASPLPIASSGELSIMPPDTGLPTGRSSVSALLESVPHDPAADVTEKRTRGIVNGTDSDTTSTNGSDTASGNDFDTTSGTGAGVPRSLGTSVSAEEASLHG